MSRKGRGTPLWLDVLVVVVLVWGVIQLVNNPEVQQWVETHCGWVCR